VEGNAQPYLGISAFPINVTANGFDVFYQPGIPSAGGPQLVNFIVIG
jgi:hypothetical protein